MNNAGPKPSVVVRPVRQEEWAAWRELMQQHHYLGLEHPVGQTRGFAKRNRHYWHHGQPELVFVCPLVADAVARLVAPFPPPHTSTPESLMMDVNALPLQGEGGLIDLLQTLVDPRKPRGVRHPVCTVVGIAVCAALSGARSFCAIGEWAQGLTREALDRLGSKRRTPPSEPTIRRVLQGLDANRLDAQISPWVAGGVVRRAQSHLSPHFPYEATNEPSEIRASEQKMR